MPYKKPLKLFVPNAENVEKAAAQAGFFVDAFGAPLMAVNWALTATVV